MSPPWDTVQPNRGFVLEDAGDVVGAYLALYSERQIDGRSETFCNLGAWCVLPSHRHQGLRLLRALLRQHGYHFTDLSPSGNVVPLNLRLGFTQLDTETALTPNLPWPPASRGVRLITDPHEIPRHLSDRELAIYRDHVRRCRRDTTSCWCGATRPATCSSAATAARAFRCSHRSST